MAGITNRFGFCEPVKGGNCSFDRRPHQWLTLQHNNFLSDCVNAHIDEQIAAESFARKACLSG